MNNFSKRGFEFKYLSHTNDLFFLVSAKNYLQECMHIYNLTNTFTDLLYKLYIILQRISCGNKSCL